MSLRSEPVARPVHAVRRVRPRLTEAHPLADSVESSSALARSAWQPPARTRGIEAAAAPRGGWRPGSFQRWERRRRPKARVERGGLLIVAQVGAPARVQPHVRLGAASRLTTRRRRPRQFAVRPRPRGTLPVGAARPVVRRTHKRRGCRGVACGGGRRRGRSRDGRRARRARIRVGLVRGGRCGT